MLALLEGLVRKNVFPKSRLTLCLLMALAVSGCKTMGHMESPIPGLTDAYAKARQAVPGPTCMKSRVEVEYSVESSPLGPVKEYRHNLDCQMSP